MRPGDGVDRARAVASPYLLYCWNGSMFEPLRLVEAFGGVAPIGLWGATDGSYDLEQVSGLESSQPAGWSDESLADHPAAGRQPGQCRLG